MRSLLLFFLIYLLSLILLIIPPFFVVFKISLVFILSYLTFSGTVVSIQNATSSFTNLSCGVPQGSRYWLTSFHSLYNSRISKSSIKYQLYADDFQLYILFHSVKFNFFNWNTIQYFLWHTLLDARTQTNNCFLINPKLNSCSLVQNNNGSNFLNSQLYLSAMISSQSALLLVILASYLILTCYSQVKLTQDLSKSCHFHIRDIRRIRHLLPLPAATALANSLVSSKLDYYNSLYRGILCANEQNTAHAKYSGSCGYKNIKILTHHTNTKKYIGF